MAKIPQSLQPPMRQTIQKPPTIAEMRRARQPMATSTGLTSEQKKANAEIKKLEAQRAAELAELREWKTAEKWVRERPEFIGFLQPASLRSKAMKLQKEGAVESVYQADARRAKIKRLTKAVEEGKIESIQFSGGETITKESLEKRAGKVSAAILASRGEGFSVQEKPKVSKKLKGVQNVVPEEVFRKLVIAAGEGDKKAEQALSKIDAYQPATGRPAQVAPQHKYLSYSKEFKKEIKRTKGKRTTTIAVKEGPILRDYLITIQDGEVIRTQIVSGPVKARPGVKTKAKIVYTMPKREIPLRERFGEFRKETLFTIPGGFGLGGTPIKVKGPRYYRARYTGESFLPTGSITRQLLKGTDYLTENLFFTEDFKQKARMMSRKIPDYSKKAFVDVGLFTLGTTPVKIRPGGKVKVKAPSPGVATDVTLDILSAPAPKEAVKLLDLYVKAGFFSPFLQTGAARKSKEKARVKQKTKEGTKEKKKLDLNEWADEFRKRADNFAAEDTNKIMEGISNAPMRDRAKLFGEFKDYWSRVHGPDRANQLIQDWLARNPRAVVDPSSVWGGREPGSLQRGGSSNIFGDKPMGDKSIFGGRPVGEKTNLVHFDASTMKSNLPDYDLVMKSNFPQPQIDIAVDVTDMAFAPRLRGVESIFELAGLFDLTEQDRLQKSKQKNKIKTIPATKLGVDLITETPQLEKTKQDTASCNSSRSTYSKHH